MVRQAEEADLGLVAAVGHAAHDPLFHDLLLVADDGARLSASPGSTKLDSTRSGTRWAMASSTERLCSTLAPSEAISSISS